MPDKQELYNEVNSFFRFLVEGHSFEFSSFEYSAGCFGNFVATYSSLKMPEISFGINIQIVLDRSQIFINISSTKKPNKYYSLHNIIGLLKNVNNENRIPSEICDYWEEVKTINNVNKLPSEMIIDQIRLSSIQIKSIIYPLISLFDKSNYKQTIKKLKAFE